ncbi:AcrR family transcriptional regulator [Prescottella agglutinans]|uniref:AcrR family transcriptional regulator n=2 Tax=Prescottella agglutinans TaxID=1644129 RepID=A0ABT6M8W4_9NOCA|nr:AcrR family transcriptional regulator [Prescottella agglutinans]
MAPGIVVAVRAGCDTPKAITDMTAGQRERRAALTDAVIAMLHEMEPDRIQMREVSDRSRVALGTLYRYFPTKLHLLAASMVAWNDRLSRKLEAERSRARETGVVDDRSVRERVQALYRRQLRAFQRGPNFARLDLELAASSDPYVRESMQCRAEANHAATLALMDGVPDDVARVALLAIDGTMLAALSQWTSGRISYAGAVRNVEDVVGLVLADYS